MLYIVWRIYITIFTGIGVLWSITCFSMLPLVEYQYQLESMVMQLSGDDKAQRYVVPQYCTQPPKGIYNTDGTCFLNGDLQVIETLYCIPEVCKSMVFNSRLVSLSLQSKNKAVFDAVLNFLAHYETADDKGREVHLKQVEAGLTAIDPAGLGREFRGRTTHTAILLIEVLTNNQGTINWAVAPISSFSSDIGLILNTEEARSALGDELGKLNLTRTDEEIEATLKIFKAQTAGNYMITLVSRAVGPLVMWGRYTAFKWPKVLVIATPRWSIAQHRYVKIEERVDRVEETVWSVEKGKWINVLKDVAIGKEFQKFKVNFDLQEAGFLGNPPKYRLIGICAKIPGHTISLVRREFGGTPHWYICDNTRITELPGGDTPLEVAGTQGYLLYNFRGFTHEAYPEVFAYERIDDAT